MIVALAGLWCVSGRAEEPATPDILASEGVQVQDLGDRWRITVHGRIVEVPEPQTAGERQLVEAVVMSLRSDLYRSAAPPVADVPPPRPTPPERRPPPTTPPPVAVSAEPASSEPRAGVDRPSDSPSAPDDEVPAPPLPSAEAPTLAVAPAPNPAAPGAPARLPALDAPRPWLGGWLAVELGVRSSVAPQPAAALGVQLGHDSGVGVRLGTGLPGRTSFADASSLRSSSFELVAFTSPGPIRVALGGGGSARTYRLEGAPVARHVAPFGTVGVGLPLPVGELLVEPWTHLVVDLATTRIELPGADAVLSRFALRVDLRIGLDRSPP